MLKHTPKSFLFSACVAWFALSACGSSSSDKSPGDAGSKDAGKAITDAGTSSGAIVKLTDHVAGKACTTDGDCTGGGTCAMTLLDASGGIGALLGGGGPTSIAAPGGYCTGACVTNTDCGTGGACVASGGMTAGLIGGGGASTPTAMMPGQCFATCAATADCRTGYSCGAFMFPTPDGGMAAGLGGLTGLLGGGGATGPMTCQPLPQTDKLTGASAGKACKMDSDCGGGTCAITMGGIAGMGGTNYPGGYCSGRCLADDDCGTSGACLPPALGMGAGSCVQSCASDKSCTRTGYRCRDLGNSLMGCSPGTPPLPKNKIGNPCTSDTTCGDVMGSCLSTFPAAGGALAGLGGMAATPDPAPGGYCSNQCADDADCGGGACVGATVGGLTGTAPGVCYKRCTKTDDCRSSEGYGCATRGGGGGAFFGGGGGATAPSVNVCVSLGGGGGDAG